MSAALEELAARDRELLQELLMSFAQAYAEAKDAESALDFEDLQLRARDLLRDVPAIRERERQKRQQARWVKKVAAKPPLEQKALLTGLLEGMDPTVSTAVVRSALAQFGDEALIASNGTSGSHTRYADDAAASPAPARPRASRCTLCRHAAT